ncbi:MAG TPA: hypothetical protein VJK48_05460 [Chlamydiales bacterium]|nr:hypothetical protein [Chlamydiales bacterium]
MTVLSLLPRAVDSSNIGLPIEAACSSGPSSMSQIGSCASKQVEHKKISSEALRIFRDILNPHLLGKIEKIQESEREIAEIRRRISESLQRTIATYLNCHEDGKGIYYPVDYENYLKVNGITSSEIDPSKGFANPEFFEKSKYRSLTFGLKEGKKASEALLAFLTGPTIADCLNSTYACFYQCLLDVLGEEKFNILFSFSSHPFSLEISQDHFFEGKPIIHNLVIQREKTNNPIRVGDRCFFRGVAGFGEKHPAGCEAGWSVICTGINSEGEPLFAGHGIKTPSTKSEIEQLLLDAYRKPCSERDIRHFEEKEGLKYIQRFFPNYLSSEAPYEYIAEREKPYLRKERIYLNAEKLVELVKVKPDLKSLFDIIFSH